MNTIDIEENRLSTSGDLLIRKDQKRSAYDRSDFFNLNRSYSVVLEERATLDMFMDVKPHKTFKVLKITFTIGNSASLRLHAIANFKNNDVAMVQFLITHSGVGSESKIRMRGIVRDTSSLGMTGAVTIEKGALKGKTDIEERALTVSEDAHISLVPDLIINEQTSQARHAAAIHELDKREFLYMKSRGFSHESSENLLIDGFLNAELRTWPEKIQKTV